MHSLIANIIILSFFLTAHNSCVFSDTRIVGSGNIASENRELRNFDAIRSDSSIDLHITTGNDSRCTVEGDDNIISIVETEVIGGELRISTKHSFSTQIGIVIYIETPDLKQIKLKGSGNITLLDFEAPELSLTINGSSDIFGNGNVTFLTATINGSGDLHLSELRVGNAVISINGSGNAKIRAVESLIASINGSGDIVCIGNPDTLRKTVRGSGSIVVRQ